MAVVTRGPSSVDVNCDDAYEFLEYLSPVSGLFASNDYIFRGVSSSTHDLRPAAHRDGVTLQTSPYEMAHGPGPTLHRQCAAEFYTVDKFFTIAARHGVRIPEDSFGVRKQLEDWRILFDQMQARDLNDRVWPPFELFSLLALAQHHDVPTRALDWTWNPFVAAYFAARPALESDSDDRIVVWAFDNFLRWMDQLLESSAERPLLVFTVSGADNENLRAQRGLFMIHTQRIGEPTDPFTPLSYEQLLLASLPALRDAADIIRITVHHAHARRVLSLLAGAGVTRAALFPGLPGVAQEYKDDQIIMPGALGGHHNDRIRALWEEIARVAR